MKVQIRIIGRLDQQQLIETDTEVAVGQAPDLLRRKVHILSHAIDDHKVVAQTMHLSEVDQDYS